jgi:hypothetical protein
VIHVTAAGALLLDRPVGRLARRTGRGARATRSATCCLVSSGLKALLAARRDDRTGPRSGSPPPRSSRSRVRSADNCHFLLAARRAVAERTTRSGGGAARARAGPRPDYAQMTLRYWLLPDLVRLALANGDRDTAVTAAGICETEAVHEPTAGKAAAATTARGCWPATARRCWPPPSTTGPSAVGRTGARPRRRRRRCWPRRPRDRARTAHAEAVGIHRRAQRDLGHPAADSLVRPYGIRRGARGPRRRRRTAGTPCPRPRSPVANLVARGLSNPDIARNAAVAAHRAVARLAHPVQAQRAVQDRDRREALRH